MFSSRNKKENSSKRKNMPVGLGIFDTSDFDIKNDTDTIQDDGDSDLEAELAALASGSVKQTKRPKPKTHSSPSDLDRMVAESLKDIDANVEDDDNDDDEENPDLLNELSEITESSPINDLMNVDEPTLPIPTVNDSLPSLLKSRIIMYNAAITNAKQSNDNSRARRFERGLKTLNTMMKQVNSGKTIDVNDIPPEIVVKPSAPKPLEDNNILLPTRPAPMPPKIEPEESLNKTEIIVSTMQEDLQPETKKSLDENVLKILMDRQREYKVAAINAKKSNDLEKAKNFVKIIKVFDTVITAAQNGQVVDLSDMPPPPNELSEVMLANEQSENNSKKEEAESQQSAEKEIEAPSSSQPVATTIMEALIERINIYKGVEKTAKEENNTSKARRFGRIVKQYEDAIKLYKAGKSVPFDELPTPPGFPPLSLNPQTEATQNTNENIPITQPTIVPNLPEGSANPATNSGSSVKETPPQRPPRSQDSSVGRLSGNHSNTNLMNKTIATIVQRQKEYREAAVMAKKANEIDEAKEYLRVYKGLEILLDTAKGGLPVDLSSLPISPSQRANLEDSFTIVNENDCITDDISDIETRIDDQLQKQLTMCKVTRDHHRAMGDVAGTNRFENLALSVQKDFDIVKIARRNNLPLPKFHYEQRQFNIVKCNTDLTENELQIDIVRGIGYGVANPKEVDTYVKVEFPYPQDTPFKARTQTIKDTDSPEYNEKFTVEINPKLRPCQRVFKRHSLKLEVYSKGCGWRLAQCCKSICSFSGFLRSDVLIGTVLIKLQPLESVCEIHDSFNLMDGRKIVGGKLEVKIRTRNPILTKQIEQTKEKWLVIDT